MKKYTKKERKQIVSALKAAQKVLWDGRRHGAEWTMREEFICCAIPRSEEGKELTEKLIQSRLGREHTTVQDWLADNGYIEKDAEEDEAFYIPLQAYRHAWVKSLIKEFSE